MKKEKVLKVSIILLSILITIGIFYPIYAQNKKINPTTMATYLYKILKPNEEINPTEVALIENAINNEQKGKNISSISTQNDEIPKVNVTIKEPDRIEKLLGDSVTIHAEVSPAAPNEYYDEIKYQWFRVGRMEGTASVYNPIDGKTEKDLTLENLTDFNSAKYQLAVTLYKDGQPLKKGDAVYQAYSKQVGLSVYPEINIDILDADNKKAGESIDINYGEHYKLSADVYRLYNDNKSKVKAYKDVTWETSDDSIISIDQSGYITTNKYNENAIITAKVIDVNGAERKDTVTVNVKKVPVQSITFDNTEITLGKEQTTKINATIKPENATITKIEWTIVEGENCISIDDEGIITTKEYGKAVVKATVDGQEATCTINVVRPAVENITDDVEDHHIYIVENQQHEIHAKVHPLDANQNLNWQSSDNTVATVEKVNGQNGMITAKAYKDGKTEEENTCTITVSSQEKPEIKVEYKVTVVKDEEPITNLTLNSQEVSIKVGEEFDFNIEVEPENATYSSIEWNVDDENIATIDDSGVVHGKKIGTAKVTVKVKCYEPNCQTHQQTATVHVVKTDVTGVEISNDKLTLRVGDVENLTANVLPYDATNRDVTWETSNSNIVDVDQNGKVTAISTGTTHGNGTATITVKSNDNPNKIAQCVVTVTPIKVEEIEISEKDKKITLKEGQEYKIEATIYPTIASDKKLIWKSGNDNVATVDQEGNIKAIKEGTTTITVASDEDENIYQECVITVVPLKTNVTIYTIDQNNNFISGLSLKLSKITTEGEQDIADLTPTKGKYTIEGLEDGEYKISVVGEIPTKDINGKEINIVDVVKDYIFAVKDGKVLYTVPKDEEIDVYYTNTLVLTNIVDYPDVEGETNGLSAKVGIGEDYTINNKTIDEQYKEYDEKNPIVPEDPQQPENPEQNVTPEETQPQQEETKTDAETENKNLADTSDILIGAYIIIAIVSLAGIIFVIYKKRK